MTAVVFTEEAADYVLAAAKWINTQRAHLSQPAEQPARGWAEQLIARVTSGTVDGNGNYPAVLTFWDPSLATPAWTDLAAMKLKAANGETLTSGTRYSVRPSGVLGTDDLYVTVPGGTTPAISQATTTFTTITVTGAPSQSCSLTFSLAAGTWLLFMEVGYDFKPTANRNSMAFLIKDTTNNVTLQSWHQPDEGIAAVQYTGVFQTAVPYLVPTPGPATIDLLASLTQVGDTGDVLASTMQAVKIG